MKRKNQGQKYKKEGKVYQESKNYKTYKSKNHDLVKNYKFSRGFHVRRYRNIPWNF